MKSVQRNYILLMLIVVSVTLGAWVVWLNFEIGRPRSTSASYEEYTRSFQVGVAALDSDLLPQAEENLIHCTQLLPREPAAWANLGLLYLRSGRLEESESCLANAQALSPQSNAIRKLLAHLRERQGRFDQTATILREVIQQEPNDTRSLFRLVHVIEQQSNKTSEQDQLTLLRQLLSIEPENSRLLIEKMRLEIRLRDEQAVQQTLSEMDKLKSRWQERTIIAWEELKKVIDQGSISPNQLPLLKFTNTLLAESTYRLDSGKLESPEAFVGEAVEGYLWLEPVLQRPDVADFGLTFQPTTLERNVQEARKFQMPFAKTNSGQVSILAVHEQALYIGELPITIDTTKTPTSPAEIIPFDSDNDLFTDIVIASRGGLQFFSSRAGTAFEDATTATKLERQILEAEYQGGCAVDFDLDGDLDVMVYSPNSAAVVLRNNSDQSFTPLAPFSEPIVVRSATWADFDNDGAIDTALLDSFGELKIFSNQRSGKFALWQVAPPIEKWLAITSLDATSDGQMDLVGITSSGHLVALTDVDKQSSWTKTVLCKPDETTSPIKSTADVRLFEADFDNNGGLDLLLSNPDIAQIWLAEPGSKYKQLPSTVRGPISGVIELDGDGRMDILAQSGEGTSAYWKNSGKLPYTWLDIRPQASRGKLDGDNRINSFGVGGTVELRAGSFITTQIIRAPNVHLGLGSNKQADVVRMVWPNGTFQYEFSLSSNQTVNATQRLKGSCPFLFAWNGERFEFVTDFMWSTPLGMFINASDKGGFLQTTDWVKIPANQLKAVDSVYELRVNANLWETHYFDHLALKAIDHPADVQLVVDEKFFLEPSTPKLHWVSVPQKVEQVTDHKGQDVGQLLWAADSQYLDIGQRGRYQGLAPEHWIKFSLPVKAIEKQSWLLARGWIHPTDSSVNYAIAQSDHPVPHGLALEIQSQDGSWITLNDRLGFPAGKNKTIVVPLSAALAHPAHVDNDMVHFRLRTNLEIYWDWIGLTEPVEVHDYRESSLFMISAELKSRGIVEMQQANSCAPELPVYERLQSQGQYWRDLIGYHTRPGDIHELLEEVDDRYAILTAGDEVIVRFKALPDPPSGWIREFVWSSDGWVKDGDLNTRFGKTVLPLPSHDMPAYVGDAGHLENDPVYQRFPADWDNYHTRYIDTFQFDKGLRRFLSYRQEDQKQ